VLAKPVQIAIGRSGDTLGDLRDKRLKQKHGFPLK